MEKIEIWSYEQVVYTHNLEFVLENETHTALSDFEIQTYHLITARWPDLFDSQPKKREPGE